MHQPHAGRAGREDEWPHQDGPVRLLVAGEATGGRFALVETGGDAAVAMRASTSALGSGSSC